MTQTLPQTADFRILQTLAGLAGRYGKLWAYPSQDKLIELVGRFYGRRLSRRTLCRHLDALERQGWLRRVCRHRIEGERGWCFRSTLYILTRRTLRALSGLRSIISKFGARPPKSPEDSPCDITGTQSVPSGQNQGRGGAPPPPSTPHKVALEHLQRARRLLSR